MKRLYNDIRLVLEGDDEIIDYVRKNYPYFLLTEEEFYAQAHMPKFDIEPNSVVEIRVKHYSNHSYRIYVVVNDEDLNEAGLIEDHDADNVLIDLISNDALRLKNLKRVFNFDKLFANGVKFIDADDYTLEYGLEDFINIETNTDS